MSTKRQKKLQLLKEVRAKQAQAEKLVHEQQMNVLETKLMEAELEKMKEHLSELEERRSELLRMREESVSLTVATDSRTDQDKPKPEASKEEVAKIREDLESKVSSKSKSNLELARSKREEILKKKDELTGNSTTNEEK